MYEDSPRFQPVPLELTDDPLPLSRWPDGSIRVVNSRITLEFLVQLFQDGMTPEDVAERLDTLELPDIYAIKSFYLRHRSDVDRYVSEIVRQGEAMQRWTESQPGYQERMARIQKRMKEARERERASSPR